MSVIINLDYVQDSLSILNKKPNKNLGQNFLIDEDVVEGIVNALKIKENNRVLEVGAGLGSLSHYLALNPNQIDLCEYDTVLAHFLTTQFTNNHNVNIIQKDVLKLDISKYELIVGNLPYYITNDCLWYLLSKDMNLHTLVAMIQKEAYPRVVAQVGDEDYGPLSIYVRYIGVVNKIMAVTKDKFFPRPNVDSLVFSVEINRDVDWIFAAKLKTVAKRMFQNPRKTILNNLSNYLNSKEQAFAILNKMNVSQNKRPEELNSSFYYKLTKLIA